MDGGRLIDWLGRLYGLGERASGAFTSGGTQSNLMGLMLARDHAAARTGCSIAWDGITEATRRFRIVCSSASHPSVIRSARLLGLGERSVVEVPPDEHGRLDPVRVSAVMRSLADAWLTPIAIVATAGTSDLGAIDPIEPLAQLARRHAAWLHVDAAVGGALALSEREAHRLRGIEAADSVTVDFHNLWFPPISCAAFLVRDSATLVEAEYSDDCDESLLTTRRFDALKLFVALRSHGRRSFGRAVESTLDVAAEAAELIERERSLELARQPSLNTVLFRYAAPSCAPDELDRINDAIRSSLQHGGKAAIGRACLDGRVHLKLTLTNPATTPADLRELLMLVVAAAQQQRASAVAAA
jgi:L-2,4-diaminobutyrate decarboxylase